MDYDRLLNLTTDLGYQLMASGAEIYRVEESIQRLLQAYGAPRGEVFAIPNCLMVSLTSPDGRPGAAGGVCHPELHHRQRDYAPGASYHPDAAHPGPWDRH